MQSEGIMGSLPWFPLCTRDAAAHMASRAQVFYLPVGTKHHFSELAQILSLLQKELRGPAVRGTAARTTGLSPLLLALPQPRALPAFALPPGTPVRHTCVCRVCVCMQRACRHTDHIFSLPPLLSGEFHRLSVPAGPWRSLGPTPTMTRR